MSKKQYILKPAINKVQRSIELQLVNNYINAIANCFEDVKEKLNVHAKTNTKSS